jgi:hypothetical protein
MLRLVTLVVASLLALPLIVWLATAVDARAAGLAVATDTTIAAGLAIAILYPLAGLALLGRPLLAASVFVVAAAIGFAFGQEDGEGRLAGYGVFALLLAVASFVCSRQQARPGSTDGRDA